MVCVHPFNPRHLRAKNSARTRRNYADLLQAFPVYNRQIAPKSVVPCETRESIAISLKLFQTVKRPLGMRNKFIAEYIGMIEFCSASIPQERIMIQVKNVGPRLCVRPCLCGYPVFSTGRYIPDEILF
jgi:hypothetical protein